MAGPHEGVGAGHRLQPRSRRHKARRPGRTDRARGLFRARILRDLHQRGEGAPVAGDVPVLATVRSGVLGPVSSPSLRRPEPGDPVARVPKLGGTVDRDPAMPGTGRHQRPHGGGISPARVGRPGPDRPPAGAPTVIRSWRRALVAVRRDPAVVHGEDAVLERRRTALGRLVDGAIGVGAVRGSLHGGRRTGPRWSGR